MIDLYQAYVDGKSNKDGLEDSLEKLKGQQVNFFNVKLKKIKVQTVIKKAGPGSPEQTKRSIKDLQAIYSGVNNAHEIIIDRQVEFLDEPEPVVEEKVVAPQKKEVELPPIQVEGFVQLVFDERIRINNLPEEEEQENPLIRAMANNIKLQVQKQLDVAVKEVMGKEFQRLAAEEQLRVNAYTAQWQAHCDKIVESKNIEIAARVEETKKVYEFKLAEETAKVKEAQ